MFLLCESIVLSTAAPIEIIDITALVQTRFKESGIVQGQVTLFSPHTTAFVCLNEKEQMLQRDMLDFLHRLVPADTDFRHNRNPIDGRLNAHSHLLGLLMTASQTIPVADGCLLLGGWQSVFFIELDGPRDERRLLMQISGEQ
ncbi:secondary thiamine-phosphate synthase enzyme YjbQ [Thiocapsa bogorovii]|uniref:Hypthetical protein n=1 Tax=Thiocapsa roseopersicina TaxID=1058 RepID=H9LQ51_THIRO|nr:secondary thiamine-phosphate synthase enzyme YjbQ [Thiocapsa bogorovii]AEH05872.1 hypthetical protein [Thiocapsa roseopersicina]UHD18125.1 secondary thiamine-phosphate synthase enzyme YjbQ [Thiocapsa bogorovii]